MKKKKVLLALLMTCIATTGVVALAGCAKNKGNNNNTNIENPDVPLDPGGNTQCDHANATHFAKVDATCTANGTEEYWYCAACEKHFSDAALTQETTLTELTILAHHTPGEDLIEEVAATCTKEGIKAHYVCEECHLNLDAEGNVLHDLTLPKKAHTMEHVEAHEAHCDSTGNLEYWYCSDCGVYYLDEAGTNGTTLEGVTLPKAHVFTYVQGSPATCTEAGVVEHWHCGECNKDFDAQGNELSTTVINALGHTMTHHDKVDETCTEAGTVEYWECEVCHKKYSDENGEHEITNIVIEPNTDNHKFTEWVEEVPATCTTAGVKGHYDCEDCGKHFDRNHVEIEDLTIAVDESAHTYGEWVEEVPATCTSDGVKGHYHCADCGKDFDEEYNVLESLVIPAAHKLTHVDAVGATCTTDGNVEYWECSECGKKFADAEGKEELDNVVIPAAHKLTHVEAKAPTCEEAGNIEYWECSECGAKFLDEAGEEAAGDVSLPATGHSWADEWTYDKETRTYNRICNNDEEHVEPQAAGVSAEFPYLVDDETEFKAVLALGGYIKLTDDISTDKYSVNAKVVIEIDLNGHTLTFTTGGVIAQGGAKITVKNGTVSAASRTFQAANGEFVFDKVEVETAASVAIYLSGAKATITNSTITVKYTGDGAGAGVFVDGDATLVMTDCTVSAVGGAHLSGVQGQGNKSGDNVTLTRCTVTGRECALYLPANSKTTVEGGTYTGMDKAAVEIRAGELVIDGAVLVSESEFDAAANGNGSTLTGVALGVSQHTTNQTITVTVSNTMLKGVYAFYECDVQDENAHEIIKVTLGEGNEFDGCVYSENCANIEEAHTFGEWAWNADNSVYEQTCESCGTVVSHEADGSEQFPWVVADAESLKAAVAEGGYITLAADIEAMITIAADKEVNLNLNGYRLSYEGAQVKKSGTIVNNGTLTLTGNGTVYNGVHQMAAIVNKGTATLNGVTLQRPYAAKTETTSLNSYYVIDNVAGEMTILDVHVLTDPADTFSSLVRNIGATLTIEGGTFENGDIVIKNDDEGILTVNGGSFYGAQGVQNWGTAYINGGDVRFVRTAVWSSDYKSVTYINADNFSGGLELQYCEDYVGKYLTDDTVPVLQVRDGIFHEQPVMSYAIGTHSYVATEADGYSLVTSYEDGYTVYKLALPTFATDAAGLKAAIANGGQVRLVKDMAIDETVDITKDTQIDLNGKTLSVTAGDRSRPFAVGEGVTLTIENGNIVIPEDNINSAGIVALANDNGKAHLTNVNITGWTDGGALLRATGSNCEITLDNCSATTNYLIAIMWTDSCNMSVTGGEYNLVTKDTTVTTSEKSNYYAGFRLFGKDTDYTPNLVGTFTDVTVNTNSRLCFDIGAATAVFNNCTVGEPADNDVAGYLAAAVAVNNVGHVTINGGTYSGTYAAYTYNSAGTIEINGGTFNGNFRCDCAASAYGDAKIIINKTDMDFVWDNEKYSYSSSDSNATYDCYFDDYVNDVHESTKPVETESESDPA